MTFDEWRKNVKGITDLDWNQMPQEECQDLITEWATRNSK